MPEKTGLSLFFVLGLLQFAAVYSESSTRDLEVQRQIRIQASRSLHERRDFLWTTTLMNQNIQYIPLCTEVSVCISGLKNLYDEKMVLPDYPQKKIVSRFMELVCSLTNITDTWQKSPNVKLRVRNAIFYDQKNISQEFLNDVKTYFHAELYNLSFDPTERILLPSIEEWIAEYTTQQDYDLIDPIRDAKGYMQFSMLTFTACWDTLKTSDIWDRTFHFNTIYNTVIKMRTFNSKEKIGYYNNSILKYEAIRLPFKNNEFFMVILLPYPDQPIESISKFSISQLFQLFEYVRMNIEHIDYTIPVMNSPVFSLNEKGASISGDTIVCDSFSARQTFNETNINYKPFYVDRPFGALIYDEKMRYILVHTWVKNPITTFSNPISQMQWNLFINNL